MIRMIVNQENLRKSKKKALKEQRKKEEKNERLKYTQEVLETIKKQRDEIIKEETKKIINDYNISEQVIRKIVLEIENKCMDRDRCMCNWSKNICIPLRKTCLYSEVLKYKFSAESKRNRMDIREKKNSGQPENLKNRIRNTKVQNRNEEKQTTSTKTEVRNIGFKDFLVRSNVFKCMNQKHDIENIVASVNIDNNGKKTNVKVSAGYCQNCKVYFIMESTYRSLKNKGIILCRISDEKSYMKSGYMNGAHLAKESILKQYGYNVSETQGLSVLERRKILAIMIDNKILAKSEIISYLDFFIRQRKGMRDMASAISKWEADRKFVEHYRIGEYAQYGVNAIYRK